MSKRDEYLNSLQQSKQKLLENVQEKTNTVDDTVKEFEKEATKIATVVPAKRKASTSAPIKLNSGLTLDLKVKEVKSVHKSIIIPKSINEKINELARQSGASANEVINEILKKAFTS